MELNELTYASGSRKRRKRLGRGGASGLGGTSGKGNKGQRCRSGSKIRPWFEGGQMPINRRLPKRGFKNIFRQEFQIVNLEDLDRITDTDEITVDVLHQYRLIKKLQVPVKILGNGEPKRALTVTVQAISKGAREKIEAAGGQVTIL
ncbi:50S ribosomal protein L15 [bacterium SM23_57]|nr:MAG: 50S ribosomal protein L15 [bacterium SM23_57]